MLHRFPLPLPWGHLTLLDLVEPVRKTKTEKYFRHCLYILNRQCKGGKQIIMQGPEFLIPKVAPTEGPLQ